MATVTGYTAARMKEIEDQAIVDGEIIVDDLVLTRYNGEQINAGNVRGPQGPNGTSGDTSIQVVTSTTRPVGTFTGTVIYETDTTRFYVWDGVDWVEIDARPMRCKTSRAIAQSIPSGVVTPIEFNVEDYDTDSIWAVGLPDRLVVPVGGAGVWRVILNASFVIHSTGIRHFGIQHNGVHIAAFNTPSSPDWYIGGTVVAEKNCADGDILRGVAYHTAGTALNLDTSFYPLSISAQRVV